MLKLMKLELMKNGKNPLLQHTLIILGIALFCFAMTFLMSSMQSLLQFAVDNNIAGADMAASQIKTGGFPSTISVINSLTGISFVIYGASNYAIYVVKSIKKRELQEMFLYPISRTKMLYSKVLLGFLYTCVGYIIVKVSLIVVFGLMGHEEILTLSNIIQVLPDSIAISFLGFIGMLIGIWQKSTIATVVSGVVVGILLYGQVSSGLQVGAIFTLGTVPLLIYALAFIITIATVYTLRKIVTQDFLD